MPSSFFKEVDTRTKSSPLFAKIVATAPVKSVKASTLAKLLFKVYPPEEMSGVSMPLTFIFSSGLTKKLPNPDSKMANSLFAVSSNELL